MTELLTAAQMRAIEKAAIDSGEVTGLELMERAGKGVVEAIFEEWPELKATSHRAVVLCGPGNNGGDGFVVARLLKEWGWEVEVFLYGDPERLPPDARASYERWVEIGEVRELTEEGFRSNHLKADIYVDAIFGIGLSRAPEGDIASFLRYLAGSGGDYGYFHPRLVTIDVPSGLCANSGRMLSGGEPYPFDASVPLVSLTITFDSPKQGHFIGDGPSCCGRLVVKDIGLQEWRELAFGSKPGRWKRSRPVFAQLVCAEPLVADSRFRNRMTELSKSLEHHKFSHGHALILSGPSGRGGAARLSARGALRIGAGVVTVGCPLDAIPEHAARLDAVMLRGVADGAALAQVLEDKRINALCLGPGLGTTIRERRLLARALATRYQADVPASLTHLSPALQQAFRMQGAKPPSLVFDADALTILSQNPNIFAALHEGCVLTPHAGEFARLFPDIAAKLAAPATTGPAYSKVDATREAAARAGCVVLFKGPDTVIAGPNGRCAINSAHYERAAPWLATAGSGDALAGFITGLLARGFSPFDAACKGAWLHVECALSFGPGLIAEDLSEELPKVFRALGQ